MLDVYGPDSFERSCRPGRQGWTRCDGNRRIMGRLPSYVSPAFSATALAALILHLLVELASRLTFSDPVGAVSVLVGMAAVLVVLLPFTILCVKRAHVAWNHTETGGTAKPRPPRGLASGLR